MIPNLHASLPSLQPALLHGVFQILWQQLSLLQEIVTRSDIDQNLEVLVSRPLLDQLCSVVFRPFSLVVAEIAREGLLAPVAVGGVSDGRKGGDGAEEMGVAEIL